MCKGKENLPIRWSDVSLRYNEETKLSEFGLTVKVLKEISNDFSMTFDFLKCDASGNPDSCEFMLKDYRNNQICKYMVMKDQAWSIFTEHFDKPLECPLKPGTYKLVKCPIKSDFLRLMPISDAVWKFKLWGFDKNQPVSCVEVEMQISPFSGRTAAG